MSLVFIHITHCSFFLFDIGNLGTQEKPCIPNGNNLTIYIYWNIYLANSGLNSNMFPSESFPDNSVWHICSPTYHCWSAGVVTLFYIHHRFITVSRVLNIVHWFIFHFYPQEHKLLKSRDFIIVLHTQCLKQNLTHSFPFYCILELKLLFYPLCDIKEESKYCKARCSCSSW
jgi:hypothetical protein